MDYREMYEGLRDEVNDAGALLRNANRVLQTALVDRALVDQRLAEARKSGDGKALHDAAIDLELVITNLDIVAGNLDNCVRRVCQLGTPAGPKPEPEFAVMFSEGKPEPVTTKAKRTANPRRTKRA